MPARLSKTCFLSILAVAAIGLFPCKGLSQFVISQDFNLSIPSQPGQTAGKMDDAIIDVTEHISISDLDIAVSLTHEAFFDLQISLVSPQGTSITLNPYGNNAFIITGPEGWQTPVGGSYRFLFDDEATVSIMNATLPFDEPYKPLEVLSAFDGQDVFGQWRLQIVDAYPPHTGKLDKVELLISTPEPASICLFGLAAFAIRLLNRRKTCQSSV